MVTEGSRKNKKGKENPVKTPWLLVCLQKAVSCHKTGCYRTLRLANPHGSLFQMHQNSFSKPPLWKPFSTSQFFSLTSACEREMQTEQKLFGCPWSNYTDLCCNTGQTFYYQNLNERSFLFHIHVDFLLFHFIFSLDLLTENQYSRLSLILNHSSLILWREITQLSSAQMLLDNIKQLQLLGHFKSAPKISRGD